MAIDRDFQEKLAGLRASIDKVDERLLALLNERAKLALDVGKAKEAAGASFYVPGREEDLVRHLQEANPGPFPDAGIRPVWKEIVSASLSLEHPLTVAYFGPQGTFTHQACRRQFGLSARYAPVRVIGEVFDAVERGKASYGVIPVENTTEGAVSSTLDKFMESDMKIVGEVRMRISHYLLGRSADKADVTRVYSHSQPIGQCRKWLETNLPGVPLVEAFSTAEAAKIAAEEEGSAAIASQLAGEIYGLRTIEARIEDNPNNFTRFLVIGRDVPPPGEFNKTSLLFALKDQAGALYHVLGIFYENGVNLTKIESRPHKQKAWEYVFFVDCEGHLSDPALAGVLERLRQECEMLKILGSYPRASEAIE